MLTVKKPTSRLTEYGSRATPYSCAGKEIESDSNNITIYALGQNSDRPRILRNNLTC